MALHLKKKSCHLQIYFDSSAENQYWDVMTLFLFSSAVLPWVIRLCVPLNIEAWQTSQCTESLWVWQRQTHHAGFRLLLREMWRRSISDSQIQVQHYLQVQQLFKNAQEQYQVFFSFSRLHIFWSTIFNQPGAEGVEALDLSQGSCNLVCHKWKLFQPFQSFKSAFLYNCIGLWGSNIAHAV